MIALLLMLACTVDRPRPAAPPLITASYQWGDGLDLCLTVDDVRVVDGAAWVWMRPCAAEGAAPTPVALSEWQEQARVWAP